MSEKSKPEELKEVLFESLIKLKNGTADLEQVRTIACTANSICNVVRTELKVAEFNEKRNVDKVKIDIDF